ncbi:MAG: sigma-70 family RNA polymerase sigma factor [Planctomycetota bacterium]
MVEVGKLLERVAEGDKRAFEILFSIHQARFLAVAEAITGNRSSAEDAVQEAFVRVLRFAADADGRKDPSAWLFRICVNCAKDEVARRRGRRGWEELRGDLTRTESFGAPEAAAMAEEERELVTEEIRRLRPDLRTVLTLRFTADLSYEQIAGVLGVPLGTVQSRLHSAVGELREAVAQRVRKGQAG